MSHARGLAGEEVAARWLADAGLPVVARRFRARCGEIDLVARDGATVVFVEVKLRSREDFGRPCEAVTPIKQRRLAKTAALFLARAGWADRSCRFDVIEVRAGAAGWRVTHIADAFRPRD